MWIEFWAGERMKAELSLARASFPVSSDLVAPKKSPPLFLSSSFVCCSPKPRATMETDHEVFRGIPIAGGKKRERLAKSPRGDLDKAEVKVRPQSRRGTNLVYPSAPCSSSSPLPHAFVGVPPRTGVLRHCPGSKLYVE